MQKINLMKNNLGYCCINTELQKAGITVNRSMIRKTFLDRGIEYASELALKNFTDLFEIVKWNETNGIKVYRMSSDMIPWMSEYRIKDLPDYSRILDVCKNIGKFAAQCGQRLSFHPGHFNVISSISPSVVQKSIKELDQHGEIMDMIGLERSHWNPINIHVNGTAGGKDAALERFCLNFKGLSESVRSRLVIENDDKPTQFTIQDLYDGLFIEIGIPITFDYLHHKCNPGSLSEEDALYLALSTWNCRPLTHYSDSRTIEDPTAMFRAHSDFIHNEIVTYGREFDIEIEAKAKQESVTKYLKR